jgi:hypothetical protein
VRTNRWSFFDLCTTVPGSNIPVTASEIRILERFAVVAAKSCSFHNLAGLLNGRQRSRRLATHSEKVARCSDDSRSPSG